jgi:hypothetical protein
MLPALVQTAAGGISGVNLTVLNGSQGVSEMPVGLAAQGLSIFEALRHRVGQSAAFTNGAKDHDADGKAEDR